MKKSIISVLVTLIASLASVQVFADTTTTCNYPKLEQSLMNDFGLSKDQAHSYRLSLESFALQEKLLGVTFLSIQDLYNKDLDTISNQLQSIFLVTPSQAQYFVSTLGLFRLSVSIYGIAISDTNTQNKACLGMFGENKVY